MQGVLFFLGDPRLLGNRGARQFPKTTVGFLFAQASKWIQQKAYRRGAEEPGSADTGPTPSF